MPKTPMQARIYALTTLLLLTPAATSAQTWDAQTVAELAAERAPRVRAAAARERLARGAIEGAGLRDNPSVGWERQEAFDPNAQAQDVVTARVPLDLSGRPDARRALAEVDAELASGAAERERLDAVAVALAAFYRALAASRRVAILERAQEALDEATRVLEQRREAGESSGYARARMELEAELGRSRLAQARLDARAQRDALAGLLGEPGAPTLRGELAPEAPPALDVVLGRLAHRPDVAALERAADRASDAAGAADLAWIPRIDLEAGYNRVDGPVPGHGYALGIGIEVPLFDHGQGERARAQAARDAASELRSATTQRAHAEARVAHARLTALLAERERFASVTGESTEVLLRAATSGYREGERTLVELLDARRASVETSERGLQLEMAARLAHIALRRATGELQ